MLGVDPKVDYAFKHLFGREATRPLLIDLVEAVLDPVAGHRIAEIELLNPFNPKENLDDKLSILDVKARDQSGRQLNIEMQMVPYRYYEKRILYYWARLHQQQLQEGQDYFHLRPTISISFLDHVLFPQAPGHHLRFQLLEEVHCFPLSGDAEFHILELPKFKKEPSDLVSALDRWLYFLRHAEKMDLEATPEPLQHPLLRRAFKELETMTQTDIEREKYEARRKWQLDYTSGLNQARREGIEEGLEQGLARGLEKGRIIGAINVSEHLLGCVQTPSESLVRLSVEELIRLSEQLQQQVTVRVQPRTS